MLLNNNYEISNRTSSEYPYAHTDGGTLFLPAEIEEAELTRVETAEDGTETTSTVQGYKFKEYRINSAENLPQEIVQAIMNAFADDEAALKVFGL